MKGLYTRNLLVVVRHLFAEIRDHKSPTNFKLVFFFARKPCYGVGERFRAVRTRHFQELGELAAAVPVGIQYVWSILGQILCSPARKLLKTFEVGR